MESPPATNQDCRNNDKGGGRDTSVRDLKWPFQNSVALPSFGERAFGCGR